MGESSQGVIVLPQLLNALLHLLHLRLSELSPVVMKEVLCVLDDLHSVGSPVHQLLMETLYSARGENYNLVGCYKQTHILMSVKLESLLKISSLSA